MPNAPHDSLDALDEWLVGQQATVTIFPRGSGEDAHVLITIGARTEEGKGQRLREALDMAMLRYRSEWRLGRGLGR